MVKIVNTVFDDDEWDELYANKLPNESWHDAILRWNRKNIPSGVDKGK